MICRSIHMYIKWRILSYALLTAGKAHRLSEKKIVQIFVSGLKSDMFREEIYSRLLETLVDVNVETRHELSNHSEIIEISGRIKRPEVKRSQKIGLWNLTYRGNQEDTEGCRMFQVS